MQVKPFCVRVFKEGVLVHWFILYATDKRRAKGQAIQQVAEPGASIEISAVRRGMSLGSTTGRAA